MARWWIVGLLLVGGTGCPPTPAAEIPPAQLLVVPEQFRDDTPNTTPPVNAADAAPLPSSYGASLGIDAGAPGVADAAAVSAPVADAGPGQAPSPPTP